MLLVQDSGTYIVRWPSWVGGVIAIGIMSALFAAIAEGVRRTLGLKFVWGTAVFASLGIGGYLVSAIASVTHPRERILAWMALVFCVAVMFLAPAYGISVGARRADSSFGRQIGFGVAASYAFALAGFVLGAIGAVFVRVIR